MVQTNHPTAASDALSRQQTPLASIPEVASEFGLTPWFLYELIRQRKLPPGVVVRLGPRTTRINRSRWMAFIDSGGLVRAERKGRCRTFIR